MSDFFEQLLRAKKPAASTTSSTGIAASHTSGSDAAGQALLNMLRSGGNGDGDGDGDGARIGDGDGIAHPIHHPGPAPLPQQRQLSHDNVRVLTRGHGDGDGDGDGDGNVVRSQPPSPSLQRDASASDTNSQMNLMMFSKVGRLLQRSEFEVGSTSHRMANILDESHRDKSPEKLK